MRIAEGVSQGFSNSQSAIDNCLGVGRNKRSVSGGEKAGNAPRGASEGSRGIYSPARKGAYPLILPPL